MQKYLNNILKWAQWLLFLTVNGLFILKYASRITSFAWCFVVVYAVLVPFVLLQLQKVIFQWSQNRSRNILWILVAVMIIGIGGVLYIVNPLTIGVDRWSATTYFLDALFQSVYPYGVHTHLFESNYPSPFPFWHYLNIPFWLCGDVGLGLIVFLVLTVVCVHWFFEDWHKTLYYVLIFACSPAYWWEVFVRSDGLSNALLVFILLLLMEKKNWVQKQLWIPIGLLTSLMACTRFSALIPLALYLFRPFIQTSWLNKLKFVSVNTIVIAAFFAPYVFWDTNTWIFFQRNPFMSQSSVGNMWVLIGMIVLAMWIAWNKKTFAQYMQTTSLFFFIFLLATQLVIVCVQKVSLFDIKCDISYFTLVLPYCIFSLSFTPLSIVKILPSSPPD